MYACMYVYMYGLTALSQLVACAADIHRLEDEGNAIRIHSVVLDRLDLVTMVYVCECVYVCVSVCMCVCMFEYVCMYV